MRAAKPLILILALAAIAGAAQASRQAPGDGGTVRGWTGSPLRLSGTVDRLYPGGTVSFPVRIRNRRPFPVRVRSVRARVRNASAGCDAGYLRIPPSRRRFRIRPHSARHVRLRATLAPEAVDACQDALFPLRYRARVEDGW